MHDSQRYRYNARECLLAAKEASEPYCRKLRLSMASSWLSLAHQDEEVSLLKNRDTAEPVKSESDGLAALVSDPRGTGHGPALRRERRPA